MKKFLKIFGTICGIIIVIIVSCIFILWKRVESIGIDNGDVADYDRRINIWKTVAGNIPKSKLDDMNIDYKSNRLIATLKFTNAIVNKKYKDVEKTIDTFTYFYEIKGGFEKTTYEDEPYLIPYLAENSDTAVIVIPGGGFGYKSMDGGTEEGKEVAETLNKNGISAFILHYRTNPYEYPIPYLDLQRAIKYLKYNSEKYGLNKDKISVIGFSAGGNLIVHYINQIQNKDIYPNDYERDEIDNEDATIDVASMIYPAITFNDNIPMLFALFDSEEVRDDQTRKELLNLMDNIKNFNSSNVKQFIAYGLKDDMVGVTETPKYIEKAKEQKTDIKEIIVKKGSHGFKQKFYMNDYIKWFKNNI